MCMYTHKVRRAWKGRQDSITGCALSFAQWKNLNIQREKQIKKTEKGDWDSHWIHLCPLAVFSALISMRAGLLQNQMEISQGRGTAVVMAVSPRVLTSSHTDQRVVYARCRLYPHAYTHASRSPMTWVGSGVLRLVRKCKKTNWSPQKTWVLMRFGIFTSCSILFYFTATVKQKEQKHTWDRATS